MQARMAKAQAEGQAAADRKAAAEGKAATTRKAAAAPAARRASQRQQEGHEVGAALATATRAAALPAEAQHVQNEWKTVRL